MTVNRERLRIERIYPIFVSLLGAGGLASALAYFAGVYLAFQPEWQSWADFFVPLAIPLLLVPYTLLLAYLYLRTRLGSWYLQRGLITEAEEYASQRLEANVLRSRKEALYNRITLGRVHVFRGDYEQAYALLSEGYAVPTGGDLGLRVHRWRMEAALRLENLVLCHESWGAIAETLRPKRARVYVLACRAELAAREGQHETFEQLVADAQWIDAENTRLRLAQIIGVARFSRDPEEFELALGVLETVFEETLAQIPGREAELLALRAGLLHRLGRHEEAPEVFLLAQQARADARAEFERGRVAKQLTAKSSNQTHTK